MAPSTLSQTIRQLEDRLGVLLFERTTRRVSITAAGTRLINRFRPALEEMNAALDDARDTEAVPSGLVRIHVPRQPFRLHVQPHLGRFHRLFPDIRLDITVDDAPVHLISAGYDLTIQRAEWIDDRMAAVDLGGEIRNVVVASKGYLSEMGAPETPDDLTNHRCIHWRRSGFAEPFQWQFWINDRWRIIEVSGPLVVSECEIGVQAARDDIGLAFVTESAAYKHIAARELVLLLEPFLPFSPGWKICHRKDSFQTAASKAFTEFLVA